MRFNNPPTIRLDTIIIPADLSMSTTPSSLTSVVKVATHGKYIARTTDAIINCFAIKPNGTSMPTATSFRRKPTINAPTASIQVNSPEFHPYIFVSPERLDRIKKRRKAGEWHARLEVVNNMDERFKTIRRHANVAKCTIHDLRRSAITNWAMQLPIQVVQTLAGHASITTTRKYYQPFDHFLAFLHLVLN